MDQKQDTGVLIKGNKSQANAVLDKPNKAQAPSKKLKVRRKAKSSTVQNTDQKTSQSSGQQKAKNRKPNPAFENKAQLAESGNKPLTSPPRQEQMGAAKSGTRNSSLKQGVVAGKYVGQRKNRFGQQTQQHKSYKSNKVNVKSDQAGSGQRMNTRGVQTGNRRNFSQTGTTQSDPRSGSKRFTKAKKPDSAFKRKEKNLEKEFQIKQKSAELSNPVPKSIDIMEHISVSELARKMNLKASDLISKLMGMGMMVTINQQIDAETAGILASEYECTVNIVSLYDETIIETEEHSEDQTRPPIVTVMGHVDHGKTKLLDAIRKSNVVEGESGGITQHIGAYQVEVSGQIITFLDTPGHEAFTRMRSRGAQMTDIVVLVVAANDGVMPQTVEAIDHARDAGVPIIVAVNKMDLPDANVDRIKQQLADHKILSEDWGGDAMFCQISALKREGIQELLESILLQAEVMELRSNFSIRAEGRVIESKVDPGRGTVATVLIQKGTMKLGSSFLAGVYPGRVRAMFNDHGKEIKEAGPSMPVEITGLSGAPRAGDPFQVTESEKQARQVGMKRQELQRFEEAKNIKKITLHNLYDSIQEGNIQDVKVLIKGDVQGSVEAIQGSLEKLSTSEIRINVIHAGVGAINDSDVSLASVSEAIVIGFHVRPTNRAQEIADREKVEIKKYSIIYDVIEDVRAAMEGMLAPELREEHIGTAEVRETFKIPKVGVIAGSYIREGLVKRNSNIRLYREGEEIFSGAMRSLKRFKDDVKEVARGYECGIGIKDFIDIKNGDIIEVFEVKEVARKLGKTLAEIEGERDRSAQKQAKANTSAKPVKKTSTGSEASESAASESTPSSEPADQPPVTADSASE